MRRGILERLEDGSVLGDGGYFVELERRGYAEWGRLRPFVVFEHPEALVQLHREYVMAGAEALQVLTFLGSRNLLEEFGWGGRTAQLNRRAVELAREAAGPETLIAGDVCKTYAYEPDSAAAAQRVEDLFTEQLEAQASGGLDFVIGEFFRHLGEARIALKVIRRLGLPAMITMTFLERDVSDEGHTPAECARILEEEGADIVGINCLRSPDNLLELMRPMAAALKCYTGLQAPALRNGSEGYVVCLTPGHTHEQEKYQLGRQEMADYAVRARELGIRYIGACCGSEPYHIREMAKALGKRSAAAAAGGD